MAALERHLPIRTEAARTELKSELDRIDLRDDQHTTARRVLTLLKRGDHLSDRALTRIKT